MVVAPGLRLGDEDQYDRGLLGLGLASGGPCQPREALLSGDHDDRPVLQVPAGGGLDREVEERFEHARRNRVGPVVADGTAGADRFCDRHRVARHALTIGE
ncbi:hypothetical protein GCM10010425_54980 [Streptomyces spororaveus]|uniref:Uncharacterized protein n=1 Tax=Streptomyces spororaveus TaxID=284039 RepID=A0ABQ3TA67_9ACTN|nr:hypothetical protein Sspor_28650 [Streptomyces spororaveus]